MVTCSGAFARFGVVSFASVCICLSSIACSLDDDRSFWLQAQHCVHTVLVFFDISLLPMRQHRSVTNASSAEQPASCSHNNSAAQLGCLNNTAKSASCHNAEQPVLNDAAGCDAKRGF